MRTLTAVGLILILVGFALMATSLILGLPEGGEPSSGFVGCIVIFFIPVCFGGGQTPPEAVVAAALISFVVFLAFFIILIKWLRRSSTSVLSYPYSPPN